MKKIEAEIRS